MKGMTMKNEEWRGAAVERQRETLRRWRREDEAREWQRFRVRLFWLGGAGLGVAAAVGWAMGGRL